MRRINLILLLAALILTISGPVRAENIGFYFGTFDPLHSGHLTVAQQAIHKLKLNQLYILPNYQPSNKPNASEFGNRFDMVKMLTYRISKIRTLKHKAIKEVYQRNPKNYIGELIAHIRSKHGPEHQYFHVVGTDSFNKMARYKKLPTIDENRTVAVFQRPGYVARQTEIVKKLALQDKIRFFSIKTPDISSSRIRQAFSRGQLMHAEGLTSYISNYIQRTGLYGYLQPQFSLEDLREHIEPHYQMKIVDLSKISSSEKTFQKLELKDIIRSEILTQPLTLDVDHYLKSKIPPFIYKLLSTRNVQTLFIGGLYKDSLSFIKQLNFEFKHVYVISPKKKRVGLNYILGFTDNFPILMITNVFGQDRFYHHLLQYANLMYRSQRVLSNLQVYQDKDYKRLSKQLAEQSLDHLPSPENTTVVIGYHGAFNYMMSDLKQISQARKKLINHLTLKELNDFMLKHKRVLRSPPQKGTVYYPYWTYELPIRKGKHTFISFRNTYGSATRDLIMTLARKGFQHFILFGNAGGLSNRIKINHLYAPASVEFFQQKYLFVKNGSSTNYPVGSLVKVRSVLDETEAWLKQNGHLDLVDVENFDAVLASRLFPRIKLKSVVLVSDKPGEQDITKKDEDSQRLIKLKRYFFFKEIQDALKRRVFTFR